MGDRGRLVRGDPAHLALKVDGVKEILTVVVSAVSAAGAVLAAFSTHLAKARVPSLTGRAGTTVVCVVLSVELLFSVGWSLLSAYQDGREIDVLDQIVPPHSRGVLPGTEIAVTVPVRRDRAAIALEIEITDHNPGSGVCAPMATLGVWRANRTVRADPVTARRGERVTISAPKTGDRTTIGIDVGNEQSDRNCAVDVRITSARLTNKESR
jgi:hypothetical protein